MRATGVGRLETVYLNGRFVPYDQAVVSVEDRGLIFADGIYDVVHAYGGRIFALDAHLDRMEASAALVRLALPPRGELATAAEASLDRNDLRRGEASIYIQVTRGAAPRNHAFPVGVRPTVFMIARPVPAPDPDVIARGVGAIVLPDRRWQICHAKTVGLLLNCLAKQEAVDAGAFEAILERDGAITEGSATNVFAVFGRSLFTHPEGPHILSGITRQTVLRVAEELGVPVREEAVPRERIYDADEVFISGTITEVLGVHSIDGRTIGGGRPGPVTDRLRAAYRRTVGAEPA